MKNVKTPLCLILAAIAVVLGVCNILAINSSRYEDYSYNICAREDFSESERLICQNMVLQDGANFNEIKIAEVITLFSAAAILVVLSLSTEKK